MSAPDTLEHMALAKVLPAMYVQNPEAVRKIFIGDRGARAEMRSTLLHQSTRYHTLGDEDVVELVWATDQHQLVETVKLGCIPHRIRAAICYIYEKMAIDQPMIPMTDWMRGSLSISHDGRVEFRVDRLHNAYEGLVHAYEKALEEELANEGIESKCEDLDADQIDPADFGAQPDTLTWDAYEYHVQGMVMLDEAMECDLAGFFEEPVTVNEKQNGVKYGDACCALAAPVSVRAAYVRKPPVRMIIV